MRPLLLGVVLAAAVTVGLPVIAQAAGSDPSGKATFMSPIQVSGAKATLKVRYQCASGEGLWVSAKQTKSGVAATKLAKEGSSKVSSAWWEPPQHIHVQRETAHRYVRDRSGREGKQGYPGAGKCVGAVLRR